MEGGCWWSGAQSTYRGGVEIGGGVSALPAGAYTTTLYVMVDIVKEGGRATPTITSWDNFSTMMKCTPESVVATLSVEWSACPVRRVMQCTGQKIAVVLSELLQLDCHFLDERFEPSGGAQLLYFGLT